jgi:hypothetical protein
MSSKIRIALLLIVLFVIIATVVANCSGGSGVAPGIPGDTPPPTEGGDDYYEPSDNLKDIDNLPMNLSGVDGDTYTFDYSGASPDINIGDILSGSANGGYLRAVTDIVDTGTQLVISTSQASIDDAVGSAQMSAQIDYSERTNQTYFRTPGCEPTPPSGYVVDLDGIIIYQDDEVTVKIHDGEVVFNPSVNIEMTYDIIQGLTYFKATATGDLNFDYDMKVYGTGDFDVNAEKLVHTSDPVLFQIGPVWGTVEVDFFAGVDFDGCVENWLISGIDTDLCVEVGTKYEDNEWVPVSTVNHNFSPGTILGTADSEVSFRGYIRPEARVLFAGIEGPSISCESIFEMDGTGELVSPCLVYDLYGGLRAEATVLVEMMSDEMLPFTIELLNISELVAEGSVGQCGETGELIVSEISGSDVINSGEFTQYTVNASGDTGITYSWLCIPESGGVFGTPSAYSTQFEAAEVTSDTNVVIKVIVKSDTCTEGVLKTLNALIAYSDCPYAVSNIKGADYLYEMQSGFYSVTVQPYSIQGLTFRWTCAPPSAGYFLINDSELIEFFANPVDENTLINLELEVDSDQCDPITREKQVTVKNEQQGE